MWAAATRYDPDFQETRFAQDFLEFGRSGQVYTRAQIILPEGAPIDATLTGLHARPLSPGHRATGLRLRGARCRRRRAARPSQLAVVAAWRSLGHALPSGRPADRATRRRPAHPPSSFPRRREPTGARGKAKDPGVPPSRERRWSNGAKPHWTAIQAGSAMTRARGRGA